MSAAHTITGYDTRTDRLAVDHEVPEEAFAAVRGRAGVPETDRDAIGSRPLDAGAGRAIAGRLAASLNVDSHDRFPEPQRAPGRRFDARRITETARCHCCDAWSPAEPAPLRRTVP